MRTWQRWTVADDQRLRELVSAGVSVAEIAAQMGRSAGSIYHRRDAIGAVSGADIRSEFRQWLAENMAWRQDDGQR